MFVALALFGFFETGYFGTQMLPMMSQTTASTTIYYEQEISHYLGWTIFPLLAAIFFALMDIGDQLRRKARFSSGGYKSNQARRRSRKKAGGSSGNEVDLWFRF